MPGVLGLTYLTTSVLGAVLLYLPFSSVEPLAFSQALFTAISALTVTGLSIIDIGQQLTFFGQCVVMLLIQLGGLGLITAAILMLSSVGVPIGLVQRQLLREELGLNSMKGLVRLVYRLLRIIFVVETLGALALALSFVPDFGWAEGLWLAVFHSISAFNNAGFSLFSTSLSQYAGDTLVLLTLSFQFILGGIGFIVLSDIITKKDWRKLSLHSKLMLTGTLGLILISVTVVSLLEWYNPNTLGAYSDLSTRLQVAWFEAVTPRTAGFNVVDTASLTDATTLYTMVMMVIGGGSGASTAGGIKVTTALVLIITTVSFFKKNKTINAFHFEIGIEQCVKVMALLTVWLFLIIGSIFLILASHSLPFIDVVFEVVSALGTVGLSRGITGDLNGFGLLIMEVLMLLGRIGPLSLGFILATKVSPRARYPKGEIYLG